MLSRVAFLPRRRLAIFAVASVLLTGCPHGDYAVPAITLDGVNYTEWASATIPAGHLTAIGDPDAFQDPGGYSRATSRTLYAIRGVDPELAVAMAIDADRWLADFRAVEPDIEPPPVPTHTIFLSADLSPPPELCAYFEPRQESTPVECQVPIRVTLSGTVYRPWPDAGPTYKAFHGVFSFPSSALRQIGPVDDFDERLGSGVGPTAYAVQGMDPHLIIVMVGGGGSSDDALVFLAESESDPPGDLCSYSADAEVTGCP